MENVSTSARWNFAVGVGAIPLVLSFLCFPLLAQKDRVLDSTDKSRLAVLKGNVNPRALAQYDRGPVDPYLKLSYITLALKKSSDQQSALDELLKQLQNPFSSLFHKWLTPEQYADRFGVSGNDVAKIVAWLQSGGFTILQVA